MIADTNFPFFINNLYKLYDEDHIYTIHKNGWIYLFIEEA